jgi:Protein of unknown function (DUF1579)
MARNKRLPIIAFAFVCLSAWIVTAQESPPLDGPKRPLSDELLGQMVGNWRLAGTIMGRNAEHNVDAAWVLNHQFLRIHEQAADPKSSDPPYEAMVMIGYDNASDRYVAHWMDVYGGRFSETLGFGQRNGDAIEFVFEYPDGPFRTAFRWQPDQKQWLWSMRTKDRTGRWVDFSNLVLSRREGK